MVPHRLQCLPCASRSAESLDEMLRFISVAGRAEDEHDLTLLPLGQFNLSLYRRAGIKARTGLA